MIQDFNQTVAKLVEENGIPGGDSFVPRLCETLFTYAEETIRDLRMPEWRNQFQGGLNAGYILGLLGRSSQAVEFLDRSFRLHEDNRDEYSKPASSVLEFIVKALEEFGADAHVVDEYREELKRAREKEIERPEDLRRQILHIEADLECATGDIDQAYTNGRRKQGLLYQRLGDQEKAIGSFQQAIEEDPRDWRKETSIKNLLSIVDSCLLVEDRETAVEVFTNLLGSFSPSEIKIGERLPELFTDNFSTLHPYFAKLGLEESLLSISQYAAERLKNVDPKEHRDRREVCVLTEIVAVHSVSQGEYQKASDIFDIGREQLEYKHHLSRREQAEFALRAGDVEKARQLVAQDDADRRATGFDREDKIFELASLELQMGNFSGALDRLDRYCQGHKQSLVSGTYGSVFETRRSQIDIMRGVIGEDYLQRIRDHFKDKFDLRLDGEMKFLALPQSDVASSATSDPET